MITINTPKLLLIVIFGILSSFLSWGFTDKPLFAQTELDVPIDDQARYLQNLTTPSFEDWSLNPLGNQEANFDEYQLEFDNAEYSIVEQHSHEWRNTSYNHNSAVTFNVHQFVEEDTEQ